MRLITHDGVFHADDVFSTVILSGLFPDAEIVRTRDPALTCPGEGRVVYDVGGLYDPESGMFDHHQPGAPVRDDGVPYSSFGLVWARHGRGWLAEALPALGDDLERVHRMVDRGLVREIDGLDNGVAFPGGASPVSLPHVIESFSPDFDDPSPTAMREGFDDAVRLAGRVLRERARTAAAKVRAERLITSVLKEHDGGPVLELPFGMPWDRALRKAKAEHVLLVVVPRADKWTISAVPKRPGEFENRLDLPEAWAGLTGEALEAASGIAGAEFCHKGRFYGVAATREGVMRMAEAALAAAPAPDTPPQPG